MNTPSNEMLDRMEALLIRSIQEEKSLAFRVELEDQMFDVEDFLDNNGCDPEYRNFMLAFLRTARTIIDGNTEMAEYFARVICP